MESHFVSDSSGLDTRWEASALRLSQMKILLTFYKNRSQIKISNKQTPNIFLVECDYCVEGLKTHTQHNTKEQTRRQIQISVWYIQSSYRYLNERNMPHI